MRSTGPAAVGRDPRPAGSWEGATDRVAVLSVGEKSLVVDERDQTARSQRATRPVTRAFDGDYELEYRPAADDRPLAAHDLECDRVGASRAGVPVATDSTQAANDRAVANWLINKWLVNYPHKNVAVFDFYNVLTSNGGSSDKNDLGKSSGNHHRWWNGRVQHSRTVSSNFLAYPTGDSHPSSAGNRKAIGEFVPLLNYYYHRWADSKS